MFLGTRNIKMKTFKSSLPLLLSQLPRMLNPLPADRYLPIQESKGKTVTTTLSNPWPWGLRICGNFQSKYFQSFENAPHSRNHPHLWRDHTHGSEVSAVPRKDTPVNRIQWVLMTLEPGPGLGLLQSPRSEKTVLARKPEGKETHVPQCSSQHCL